MPRKAHEGRLSLGEVTGHILVENPPCAICGVSSTARCYGPSRRPFGNSVRLTKLHRRRRSSPKPKASLDRPFGGRPALLLRRLKEDKLPDLPPRCDKVLFANMAPVQLEAYLEAVEISRSDRGDGRVLQALQRIRAVSLHPDPEGARDDAALVAVSARLGLALSGNT